MFHPVKRHWVGAHNWFGFRPIDRSIDQVRPQKIQLIGHHRGCPYSISEVPQMPIAAYCHRPLCKSSRRCPSGRNLGLRQLARDPKWRPAHPESGVFVFEAKCMHRRRKPDTRWLLYRSTSSQRFGATGCNCNGIGAEYLAQFPWPPADAAIRSCAMCNREYI